MEIYSIFRLYSVQTRENKDHKNRGIWTDTEYLSISSPNAGKCEPE